MFVVVKSITINKAFSMENLRDESIPPPTRLKQLEVQNEEPSPDYTAFIDGLLWSSYPETVTIRELGIHLGISLNLYLEFMIMLLIIKNGLQILYKKLKDREGNPHCCNGSHIKCWRHYLKAF